MVKRRLTGIVRRHVKSQKVYDSLRRVLLLYQYAFRSVDDSDYEIFRGFDEDRPGLIVDVGANGGQSAIAFAVLCPRSRILSFEPNPSLWPELQFCKRLLGARYDFRTMGLGDAQQSMTLFVPVVDGLPITTRASLLADEARRQALQMAAGRQAPSEVKAMEVSIMPLDALDLAPSIVKIDVEGFEQTVLRGMTQTLARARPTLLVESNRADRECWRLLSDLDYGVFRRDHTRLVPVSVGGDAIQNWFAVPAERTPRLSSG